MNDVAPMYVWPEVGHIGRVPLEWLVPDPEQPRQNFDEEELKALAETMKAGGQRDVATVTPLTDEEKVFGLYPPHVRGQIVGGERRWRAAELAGIATLEVRVKVYANKGEQALDAFMLNEQRVALSDIENAIALGHVIQKNGWENEAQLFIAQKTGKKLWWIVDHMRLLKLCPEARVKMDPGLPQEEQLTRQSALFMAGFENNIQYDLLVRMPFGRTTAKQQITWMKRQLEERGIIAPLRKQRPSILRRLVGYFADQTSGRLKTLSAIEGFGELFQNATLEQRIAVIAGLRDTLNAFQRFVLQVEGLSSQKQAQLPTAPTPAVPVPHPPRPAPAPAPPPRVVRAPTPATPAPRTKTSPFASSQEAWPVRIPPTPAATPASVTPAPTPVTPLQPRPYVRPVRPIASVKPPPVIATHPTPRVSVGTEKAITFFGQTGRPEMKPMRLEEYRALEAKGLLKHQKEGKEKPAHLVEWEKAEEALREAISQPAS